MAEEIGLSCWNTFPARAYVIAGDQEQVDKAIRGGRSAFTRSSTSIYQDPRGLRKYDHTRLHSLATIQAEGRAARERFEKELAARGKRNWITTVPA